MTLDERAAGRLRAVLRNNALGRVSIKRVEITRDAEVHYVQIDPAEWTFHGRPAEELSNATPFDAIIEEAETAAQPGATISKSAADPKERRNPARLLYNFYWLTKPNVVRAIPTPVAIGVLLLSRPSRDEVLSDLEEWYHEIAETRGTSWAKFFVFMKLASAYVGQVLSLAERVAGIVGKMRGQKKTE